MFFNIYTPPKDNCTVEYILNHQYEKLMTELFLKRPEITVNGYPIIIDTTTKSKLRNRENNVLMDKEYFETFLHLCTVEDNFINKIICKNTLPYNLCNYQPPSNDYNICQKSKYGIVINGKIRHLCLHRLCRVHWIPKIINAFSDTKHNDNLFFCDNNNDKYLIYKYGQSSMYTVIFKEDRGYYKFKTAYPVTTNKQSFNKLLGADKEKTNSTK